MFPISAWRTVARFARRDLRASRPKAIFLIGALAVSIGSVGGVHSAASDARSALRLDSRIWLGGDLAVTTGDALDGNQIAALDGMRASGIDWTLMTWMATSSESDEAADPAVITVKAVDPAAYPYYGAIQLTPQQTLAAALSGESVAVSDDVLTRLHVRIGDRIRIGGQAFRITALIQAEPDRFTGSLGLGPRCIMSANSYARSRLARSGNSAKYRVLFRLVSDTGAQQMRARLRAIFPEGTIQGYREADRHAIEIVDQTALFLEITALLVLVLGALSIAFTVQQHLNARLDMFAIMKAIGAGGSLILAVFAVEIGLLLAAGFVGAAPIVWLVRKALLHVAGSYFVLPSAPEDSVRLIVYLVLAGAAAVSPALLQVAFQVRRLRPAILLRRGTGEVIPQQNRYESTAALLLLFTFAILSLLTFDTWKLALLLLGVAAAIVALVIAAARGLLRLLQRCGAQGWGPAQVRFALRSVSRPANRSAAVVSALALSLMIVAVTLVLQSTAAQAVLNALPLGQANLLILNAQGQENLGRFISSQTGVDTPVNIITLARLQLSSVNGVPLDTLGEEVRGGDVVNLVGCDPSQPPGQVAVAADVARLINARPGSRLEFSGRRGSLSVSVNRVSYLTGTDKFWRTFVVNCAALDGSEQFHQIAARIRPDRISAVEQALADAYPTVPVLTAAEVEATVDSVSKKTIGMIHAVAWYAIASAVAVMIAIVAASRAQRLREIAILCTLGARRRTMFVLLSLEFLAIGTVAGLLGVLAAWGLNAAVLIAFLHRAEASFPAAVIGGIILGSIVISLVAGWLPSWRLLREKPLAILRRE